MLGMRNFKIEAVFLMDKVLNLYSHPYPLHETKWPVFLMQNKNKKQKSKTKQNKKNIPIQCPLPVYSPLSLMIIQMHKK